MTDYTNPVTQGLVVLSSIGFVVAIYFTFKLSEETKGEKYWFYFLVAAVALGLHKWIEIPYEIALIRHDVFVAVQEVAAIVGALSFAYASRGLYQYMRRIREKVKDA